MACADPWSYCDIQMYDLAVIGGNHSKAGISKVISLNSSLSEFSKGKGRQKDTTHHLAAHGTQAAAEF